MPKPVIKWAGGKTQLLPEILKRIDFSKNTYVEPFLGGASVFIYLLKNNLFENYIVNDLNISLFSLYKNIKKYPNDIIQELSTIQEKYNALHKIEDKKEMYLLIRKKYNNHSRESIKASSWFIFLNKSCFNGLYRENSKGGYNVPFGQKNKINIFDENNIRELSRLFNEKNVIFCNKDYKELNKFCNKDTFIYLDPPYRPVTKGGFSTYHKDGFNDKEQIELKEFLTLLNEKDVSWLLSNSDPETQSKEVDLDPLFFKKIYSEFNISKVSARRNINSNGSKRNSVKEIMVTNYEWI